MQVRVEAVQKWYRDWWGPARAALHPVNLEVEAGETVLLVGPNGAGKSTLLGLMAGVRHASAGTLHIAGPVGFAPERTRLPTTLTPAEILMCCARIAGLAPTQAATQTTAVLEQLGLTAQADWPCGRLSAGQQRRVLLAQALVHDPRTLLLDEPLNALDPEGIETVVALLHSQKTAGAAMVIATHRLTALAGLADRVALLRHGRLQEMGTADQVLASLPATIAYLLPPGVPDVSEGVPQPSVAPLRTRRVSAGGRNRLLTAVQEAGGRVLRVEPDTTSLGAAAGDLEETLA